MFGNVQNHLTRSQSALLPKVSLPLMVGVIEWPRIEQAWLHTLHTSHFHTPWSRSLYQRLSPKQKHSQKSTINTEQAGLSKDIPYRRWWVLLHTASMWRSKVNLSSAAMPGCLNSYTLHCLVIYHKRRTCTGIADDLRVCTNNWSPFGQDVIMEGQEKQSSVILNI